MKITNRTTHDVQQGTGAWLRLREGFFTASEAPAALGVSKYVSRSELLRQKHTGVAPEHSPATLGKFAAGHDAEARARPMAEAEIGGELFPVTMSAEVDGLRLLASLDGQKLEEDEIWETKLWNEELAANVQAGTLPEHYLVQMDQELLVSGAERCLFTCTDGTPERFVSCWHEADPARFEALLAGWKQFAADLAAYVKPEPVAAPAAIGKTPDTLPALRIEVTGAVTASNLAEFKATALGAIRSVNRNLQTDQDFADAEKAVKWCSDIEARLKAAKEHALSQTADIDALFKALDDIGAEAKAVRLDLDKVVTRRKTEVKEEAVAAARAALDKHIADLNGEIAPMRLRPIAADFAGCIKGMRSVASMQDKLDGLLATTKIAADAEARAVRANVATFQEKAAGFEFLFADLGQIVHKAADDFAAVLQARIATHQAAEAEKARKAAEAEAQRIAAAEQRAREQEAARIAAQQAAEAAAATARQVTAEQHPQQVLKAEPATAEATDRGPAANVSPRGGAMGAGQAAAAAPAVARDEPATLTLGVICERLGVTVRAEFLADTLHVKPAATPIKGRGLYTERQFATICRQLQSHVSAMAELYAGEPA